MLRHQVEILAVLLIPYLVYRLYRFVLPLMVAEDFEYHVVYALEMRAAGRLMVPHFMYHILIIALDARYGVWLSRFWYYTPAIWALMLLSVVLFGLLRSAFPRPLSYPAGLALGGLTPTLGAAEQLSPAGDSDERVYAAGHVDHPAAQAHSAVLLCAGDPV
ncbi:MAG: hypothetical protein HC915_00250 [Anaerolineae bacterium]|nr:hypothetical protein [Anaerolineae bacterium]